jgi:hypothetical protein
VIKEVYLGLTVSLYPTINDCSNQSHRPTDTKTNITIVDYTTTNYNFITTEDYKNQIFKKIIKSIKLPSTE